MIGSRISRRWSVVQDMEQILPIPAGTLKHGEQHGFREHEVLVRGGRSSVFAGAVNEVKIQEVVLGSPTCLNATRSMCDVCSWWLATG